MRAETAKLCEMGVAGEYSELPACDAEMEQVPAAEKEAVKLLTVHTFNEVDTKDTGKPELEVAESVSGVPTVWAPGLAKEMVCAVAPWTVSVMLVVAMSDPEVPVMVIVAGPAAAVVSAFRVITCVPVAAPEVNEAVTPVGRPVAVSTTDPVKPPRLVTETVAGTCNPWPTVSSEVEGARVNPCAVEPYHFTRVVSAAGLFCGV